MEHGWISNEMCLSFWGRRIMTKTEGNILSFYITFNLQSYEVAWARYNGTESFPVLQFMILPASTEGHTLYF